MPPLWEKRRQRPQNNDDVVPVDVFVLGLMRVTNALFDGLREAVRSNTLHLPSDVVSRLEENDPLQKHELLKNWLQDRKLDSFLLQHHTLRTPLADVFGAKYPYLHSPTLVEGNSLISETDAVSTLALRSRLWNGEANLRKELRKLLEDRQVVEKTGMPLVAQTWEKRQDQRFKGMEWRIKNPEEAVPENNEEHSQREEDTQSPPAHERLDSVAPSPQPAVPSIQQGNQRAETGDDMELDETSQAGSDVSHHRQKTIQEEFEEAWRIPRMFGKGPDKKPEKPQWHPSAPGGLAKFAQPEIAYGRSQRVPMETQQFRFPRDIEREAKARAAAKAEAEAKARAEAGDKGEAEKEDRTPAEAPEEETRAEDFFLGPDHSDEALAIRTIEDAQLVEYKGHMIESPPIQLVRIKNFLRDGDIDRIPDWQRKCAEIAEYLAYLVATFKDGDHWALDLKRVSWLLHSHVCFEHDNYSRPKINLDFPASFANTVSKRLPPVAGSTIGLQRPKVTSASSRYRPPKTLGAMYRPVVLKRPAKAAEEVAWHPMGYSLAFDGLFHAKRLNAAAVDKDGHFDPAFPKNPKGPMSLIMLDPEVRVTWDQLRGLRALEAEVLRYCKRAPRQLTDDIVTAIKYGRWNRPTAGLANTSGLEFFFAKEEYDVLQETISMDANGDAQLFRIRPVEELLLRIFANPPEEPIPGFFEPMEPKTKILADRAARVINFPDHERAFSGGEGVTLEKFLELINQRALGPVIGPAFSMKELKEELPKLTFYNVLSVTEAGNVLRYQAPILPELRFDFLKMGGRMIGLDHPDTPVNSEYEKQLLQLTLLAKHKLEIMEYKDTQEKDQPFIQNFFRCLAYRLGFSIYAHEMSLSVQTEIPDQHKSISADYPGGDKTRYTIVNEEYRANTLRALKKEHKDLRLKKIGLPDPMSKIVEAADEARRYDKRDPDEHSAEQRCKELVRQGLIREAYETKSMIWHSNVRGTDDAFPIRPRSNIWSFADTSRAAKRPLFWRMDRWPVMLQTEERQREIQESGPFGAEGLNVPLGGHPGPAMPIKGWPIAQTYAEAAQDRRSFVPGAPEYLLGDTPLQKAHVRNQARNRFQEPEPRSLLQRLSNTIPFLGKRKATDPLELPKLKKSQIAKSVAVSAEQAKSQETNYNNSRQQLVYDEAFLLGLKSGLVKRVEYEEDEEDEGNGGNEGNEEDKNDEENAAQVAN